jgi:hypothetical protein
VGWWTAEVREERRVQAGLWPCTVGKEGGEGEKGKGRKRKVVEKKGLPTSPPPPPGKRAASRTRSGPLA